MILIEAPRGVEAVQVTLQLIRGALAMDLLNTEEREYVKKHRGIIWAEAILNDAYRKVDAFFPTLNSI